MRSRLTYGIGEFARSMEAKYVPVSDAGVAAIEEVAKRVKTDARAHIAAAGFSIRWQNALRVNVYKPGQTKVAGEVAAAWVYHAIPYAGVFERGATVNARMWVPMPWAPKAIGRNQRMSPDLFVALTNQRLFKIRRGQRVYLAAKLQIKSTFKSFNSGAAVGRKDSYSLSSLRRGSTGSGKIRVNTLVPLFMSVSSVTFKKRLNILKIVESAANTLAEAYFRHYKGDE